MLDAKTKKVKKNNNKIKKKMKTQNLVQQQEKHFGPVWQIQYSKLFVLFCLVFFFINDL